MILTDGTTSVELPLLWQNRYQQTPLAVSHATSITGKLLRAESLKIKGTLIALRRPPIENMGCVRLFVVRQIHAWASLPNQDLTLVDGADSHTVRFALDPIKTAEPLARMTREDQDEWWKLEIDLITV